MTPPIPAKHENGLPRHRPLRLGILGSGQGSNAQAILDAIRRGALQAEVVCVVSDVADAPILERARCQDIPAHFIDAAPFKTKLDGAGEQRVIQTLRAAAVDVVVLAGFMRIVKTGMLTAFANRIVNIHPSLLPAFPGMASWKQALDYGVKVSGCTVHFVDDGMDAGPILAQRAVPVLENDTPETLHARIQEQEHGLYPEALDWLAWGRVSLRGRHVHIAPPPDKEAAQ